MRKLAVGSLFAGIGGIDIGLQRSGMEISFQVEIDPFCRAVLARHWPKVERFGDIRKFSPSPDFLKCDILAGGFPCVDISRVGRKKGFHGPESGPLWAEFHRVIRLLRPRIVVLENVSALLARGFGRVLGDLAEGGYDAEWDCLPAAAFGAPHIRDRIFVLAYRRDGVRLALRTDADGRRHRTPEETVFAGRSCFEPCCWWADQPGLSRVANGISSGVDRRKCLGNSVVTYIAWYIGRMVEAARERGFFGPDF
jgi:DNA (cytosine-5)-methyltransferase 1